MLKSLKPDSNSTGTSQKICNLDFGIDSWGFGDLGLGLWTETWPQACQFFV